MIGSHKKTIYDAIDRDPVHPFPARMSPGIALDVISSFREPLCVLDPMMGSGTVLAIARAKGHRAFGVDIDPLAVLITKAWTAAVDPEKARGRAKVVLARAHKIFDDLAVRDAYPASADDETRRFARYWFDGYARRQLSALASAIHRVEDDIIRDLLWCSFSRLIITKQAGASLAMDLSHSRPHKSFDQAPVKPFQKFLAATERVLENCVDVRKHGRGPKPRVTHGDARRLPLDDSCVDLILTSPPYLNAIDYLRCSKFSLIWMGYNVKELRQLRAVSVGTEAGGRGAQDDPEVEAIVRDLKLRPVLSGENRARLERFIGDMRNAVQEAARVLRPNGMAVYVVGENTIRGTYVRNSLIIKAVASLAGLSLCESRRRNLPANRRYLPPPDSGAKTAALDARMRREVVLRFEKPAV